MTPVFCMRHSKVWRPLTTLNELSGQITVKNNYKTRKLFQKKKN